MELNNNVIEYMSEKNKAIIQYKEKFVNSKSKEELIDIGGEIVEILNDVVKNLNNFLRASMESDGDINNFKNKTTLFKEYFINFLDGMLNNNKYVVDKYIRYINVSFDIWINEVQQYFYNTKI